MSLDEIWCDVDDCPVYVCDGPHHRIRTTLGIEYLRFDQEPLGQVIAETEPQDDTT